MPELTTPTTRLHEAWLHAHSEWGPGTHEDGFGLWATDEVVTPAGFSEWVARLVADPRATYKWIVEDGSVLGGIVLRHRHNEYVAEAGHIGFGIRPTARRHGLGVWSMGRILDHAQRLGLDRVLVVCDEQNIASAKTIERVGGILEAGHDVAHRTTRRYWIQLARSK